MKNQNFIVRIPEPCHEDWNKMQPDDKGKFCGSCSKSVHDFTNKTDTEIKDILLANKGVHMCGHFKKTQVNRPLNISINFSDLPKNVSTTKAFAIALFFAFGTMLFSCTAIDGKKIDTIEVVNGIKENEITEVVPPDSLVTMLGQTVTSEPAFLGNIITCNEQTVDGGIRFDITDTIINKLPNIITPPDSMIFQQATMGMMIIDTDPLDTNAITERVPVISQNTDEEVIMKKENDFGVYPNPSTGEFTIKYNVLKRADVRVDILDLKGALLKTVVNVASQFDGKYNTKFSY
ncbi:MAG: hypothetical protein H0W73_19935 [Bacteroidetes bacterium]|nr:hypothetical protein [Bacteroidota bacterium]